MSARGFLALIAVLACGGCGTGLRPAFDPRFPDDDRAALAAITAELAREPPEATGAARLVAAVPGPALVLADLDGGRPLWRVALETETRPELHGDLVLTSSRGDAVALDAATGRLRWRCPLGGMRLLGGARAHDTLLLVARSEASRDGDASRLVALEAATGRVVWRHDLADAAGRPAASGTLFFVPWQRRQLSALDARDGRERLRLRARDHVIEWVEVGAAGIRFGDQRSLRLGAGYDGTLASTTHHALPLGSLPGEPSPHESAFASWPAAPSARGRIAVHVPPPADTPGRFFFVFYRAVLAFDAAGLLDWAYLLDRDVVAATSNASGLVVALEDGRILALGAATGEPTPLVALGMPIASATLEWPSRATPAPVARNEVTLRARLLEIAIDPDSRLLPVRIFAVRRLATLAEPAVTRDLLDVYAQRNAPPALRRAVADELPNRTLGTEHLLDALLTRYDFLEQTREAPLAVIVPALVARGERRALPRLVERMRDPTTPLATLPTLVSAITALGGSAEVDPLLALVRRYRADSAFAQAEDVLLGAASGVLRHGADEGRSALRAIADAPRTSPTLAEGLHALLALAPAPAAATARAPAAMPERPLPRTLSQADIHATFVDHVDGLRSCVLEALVRDPTLRQVRLAFIVESDGSAHAWSFVPRDPRFGDCLEPGLRTLRFPRVRSGRRTASYTIAVREETPPVTPMTQPSPSEPTWWARAAARAAADEPANAGGGQPWWRLPDVSYVRIDVPPRARPEPPTKPGPSQEPTPASGEPLEDRWWVPVEPAGPSGAGPSAP